MKASGTPSSASGSKPGHRAALKTLLDVCGEAVASGVQQLLGRHFACSVARAVAEDKVHTVPCEGVGRIGCTSGNRYRPYASGSGPEPRYHYRKHMCDCEVYRYVGSL